MLCATLGPTSSAACKVSMSAAAIASRLPKVSARMACGPLTDKRDAETIDHARQRLFLRRFDVA